MTTECLHLKMSKRSTPSSQGPSLVLVGLSLLCAGWLLGYGLAPSKEILTTSAQLSTNGRHYHPGLLSWREEPKIKKAASAP